MAAKAVYELKQVNEFSYCQFMIDGRPIQGMHHAIIASSKHEGMQWIQRTANLQNFCGTRIEYTIEELEDSGEYTLHWYLPRC